MQPPVIMGVRRAVLNTPDCIYMIPPPDMTDRMNENMKHDQEDSHAEDLLRVYTCSGPITSGNICK